MMDTRQTILYLRQQAQKVFYSCPYDISDQTFTRREHVHEWKNHIHQSIEEIWPKLGEEARLVAVIMAEVAADNEGWK